MIKTCPQCAKEFNARHSWNKFCTRACAVVGRPGRSKKSFETKPCASCGKAITGGAEHLSKRVFCSKVCYAKQQTLRQKGKSNHNYRAAGFKVCIGCGKRYHSYSAGRKFCGALCAMTKSATYAMRNQQIGRDAEDRCSEMLSDAGFYVLRTRNSRGPYDVCAVGRCGTLFIQVKSTDSRDLRNRKVAIRELSRLPFDPVFDGSRSRRKQAWVWVGGRGAWHVTEVMPDGSEAAHWL